MQILRVIIIQNLSIAKNIENSIYANNDNERNCWPLLTNKVSFFFFEVLIQFLNFDSSFNLGPRCFESLKKLFISKGFIGELNIEIQKRKSN